MLAIYIRVSTVLQAEKGTSLTTQLEQCIRKAGEEGFQEWQVFADEGYSGMDLDRPAITNLRDAMSRGEISALLCWDVDRLARGTVYQLLLLEEIRKYKIRLIFVNNSWQDTPEGRLLFQMQSIIAEYELAKIKLRTSWGRLRCARSGKIMPMRYAPFGYDYDSKEGRLLVNRDEAEYVLKVFNWYVYDNLSMREVGKRLLQLGVPAKGGGSWSASSVSRILQSPVYTGRFYYNRRESSFKPGGGHTPAGSKRREYTLRPRDEWVEIKVPALISEELFEKARQQASRKMRSLKNNHKFPYLFKGLLRCGHCGRSWQATTTTGGSKGKKLIYPLYRCPGKFAHEFGDKGNKPKCPSRSLNGLKVDEFLWGKIESTLLDPEVLEELLRITPQVNQNQEKLAEFKTALARLEKDRQKVLSLFRRELITEEEAAAELLKLKSSAEELQGQEQLLKDADAKQRQVLETGGLDNLAADIRGLLKGSLTPEEKRHLVELLVKEVVVDTGEKTAFQIKGPICFLEHRLKYQEV